jgi:HEPN domain-containing protein
MTEKEIISTWTKLALSDLKSSKILYHEKQYRTSYFLFQQATEKCNKAHALKFKFVTENDFKVIRHDQFKLDRKFITKRIEELEKKITEPVDSLKLMGKIEGLKESLRSIDEIKNKDLINIISVALS